MQQCNLGVKKGWQPQSVLENARMYSHFALILLTNINHIINFPLLQKLLVFSSQVKEITMNHNVHSLRTPGWLVFKAPHGGVVRTLSSTLRILERQKVRSERKKHRFELFILTSVWTDRTAPVSLHATLNWASAGFRESMNGSESTTSPSKLLEPLKWFRLVFPTGLTT